MFGTLLIANRGEIACRVIRTARRLGIRTVAVYSDADARAPHVALADEAYRIGPPPARESYLRIDAILDVARRSGADAVHPGYGFLSENAEFAEACAAAGLVFVGPPASAIRAMGSKAAAKALMERAAVPLVPGYHGDDQDPDRLAAEAGRIGYPVLIKASAGGGGKGMRVVERAADFAAALAGAKREAAASFADDRVLIEKYLTRPRHIEIQVFADGQGETVYLFERDCSLQRRHQKVIEEAPAPGMPPERRRAMGEAAVAAAKAVGYVGAGTVEFIAEDDRFYFMEMNTRLQVEHPVTEMITGLDLVEWQLRVAAGGRLPLRQEDLAIRGHAFEVRLYAEDPDRDFLPATGTLKTFRTPPEGAHVRLDAGVREGDAIGVHYDPMIAKLIVWDESRSAALQRLRGALDATAISGLATNLAFLRRVAGNPAFAAGEVDTGFIGRHRADLVPAPAPAPEGALAAAALRLLLDQEEAARTAAARAADRWSPWHRTDGWRLNGDTYQEVRFREAAGGERIVRVDYPRPSAGGLRKLSIGDRTVEGAAERLPDGALAIVLDGVRRRVVTARDGAVFSVFLDGASYRFTYEDPHAPAGVAEGDAGRLAAPMPGKIVQVLAEPGAQVKRGQPLLVLEAMKMEHTIAAPADGRLAALCCAVGDLVDEGAELVVFEPEEETTP
ncbi:MAG TPA: acetyl/propionyl/methylcrotonyl-CoA carboxylase subunit alpha [Stellaceae bacterium]